MKVVRGLTTTIGNFFRFIRQYHSFYRRSFTAPSPNYFKMKTLLHFADVDGVWLETGTYKGATTKYLASRFSKVISLVPSDHYHQYASSKLRKFENVHVRKGSSEELFEDCLISVAPCANLWLDGHFSDGLTFFGDNVSPIIHELEMIEKNKDKFNTLIVFIDDIRLFPRDMKEVDGYPNIQMLLNWCRKNDFSWQIENDIMIAKMLN